MGQDLRKERIRYALVVLIAGVGICSADTSMIAVTGRQDDSHNLRYLYAFNPDGSELVALVEEGIVSYPRWSPDGAEIAFISHHRNFTRGTDIAIVNSDGSNPRILLEQRQDQAEDCVITMTQPLRCSNGELFESIAWPAFGLSYYQWGYTIWDTRERFRRMVCFLNGQCVNSELVSQIFDFTSDGQMVYVRGDLLRIARNPFAADYESRTLTEYTSQWGDLQISPDDSRITFSDSDGIVIVDIDGSRTLIELDFCKLRFFTQVLGVRRFFPATTLLLWPVRPPRRWFC